MFGRWKWVAAVVAYMPLVGLIVTIIVILATIEGIHTPGTGGISAVSRGIAAYIYLGWLTAIVNLVSVIWFTIMLGKQKTIGKGKVIVAFIGLLLLAEIVAPICFHMLNRTNLQGDARSPDK